ncbi:hypothetical protein PACILC2_07900 [Paenibacillus cisolokensis]|uniref:Uncharacterized protein n=1 Tax=Paenibacillus cisolokensis TaxID=1658519 RepID=A0ABQ4N215_9BACL|nr:hypothetical protein PACILC2_07900 [Paenibacillus cisolokensis]
MPDGRLGDASVHFQVNHLTYMGEVPQQAKRPAASRNGVPRIAGGVGKTAIVQFFRTIFNHWSKIPAKYIFSWPNPAFECAEALKYCRIAGFYRK